MYKCKIIRRLLIDKINILIGIVTSIPLLLFVLISISNIDSMSYQTSLLVFSNLSILPTTISCLYYLTHSVKNNDYRKSLIIEFTMSYSIIFISGIYHFCDSARICYGDLKLLHHMDFIVSYTLVAIYVFHIAKLSVIYKIMAHVFLLIVFTFCIEEQELYPYITLFYIFPIGIVMSKFIERLYKKKLIIYLKTFNIKYFSIAIILFFIGILFGPLNIIVINNKYYWISHSLLWHFPIMMSSFFILKSYAPKVLTRPPSGTLDSIQTIESVQTVDSDIQINKNRENEGIYI